MNRLILSILLILTGHWGFADENKGPRFDYGYGESEFKWGVRVPITNESSDFELRLGTRLQALMENEKSEDSTGASGPNSQDFYARRVRLQVEAKFRKKLSYYMDIRADKIDKGNSGDNRFALGDAFFQVKELFGNKNLKLRLFRAKYDISRTQTVSSSRLLAPTRSSISDYAANYISKDRRGTNVQILGNWSNRIKTQIVIGDSIQEDGFKDALGNKGDGSSTTLEAQGLAHGARLRVSPFAGWEDKKLKETQFGHGKHFTLGAGAFFVNNINFIAGGASEEIDRQLYNFDLSFHYGPFSIMSEYFIFDGMVEDFKSGTTMNTGKSEGWVVQGEYVFTDFHYIAPYFRYQDWDRFTDNDDFDQQTWLLGVNYYLKGNKLRIGGHYQETKFADGLQSKLGSKETLMSLNLMMHY